MDRARVGSLAELREKGCLTGKVGARPVCVWWSDGHAYAVDDRCPHMGFPLHRGTLESGLLTCHWHHARFDLISGGTLDPFADDVGTHEVALEGGDVYVALREPTDPLGRHLRRLEEGLEHGLSLVIAKAVLGLLELAGPTAGTEAALRAGVEFGTRNREAGWGAGLTVLSAVANVLPVLDPDDRPLALVHGLSFVSRDTRGRPPRFPLHPLGEVLAAARLEGWYRRSVDTRNGEAAERVLATAVASGLTRAELAATMGAAVTDHVLVDNGHAVDFTNKAFEVLNHLDESFVAPVLTSLAGLTAAASRSEETGEWRHPHDLAALLVGRPGPSAGRAAAADRRFPGDEGVDALAWTMLAEEPSAVLVAIDQAAADGATGEELARAVAYAAALRLARFHTGNDHGDWDVVHHAFTSANALHQLVCRTGGGELLRGVDQGAMRVFLDRFLNVPPARLPVAGSGNRPSLQDLGECWDREGMVDEAGAIVYGFLRSGGEQQAVLAALGAALLAEDAGFHWYQTYEAAVRQSAAWPPGSEQAALVLTGAARFLAAHTPTRRELAQVVRIAGRLGRGEALHEEL